MHITSLQLFQFRNYKHYQCKLNPDSIVLYGANGVGKTNILEAIYVGTIGKSHRTNDTSDLLMVPTDQASIIISFEKKDTLHTLHIKLYKQGSKEILLNNTKITQKELLGTLHTVIFSPEDLQLIKASPSGRRRFIDLELSQTSSTYYHKLLQYNRVLQQRNYVLKQGKGNTRISLEEWDEQLADLGSFLIQKRLESLKKINLLIDLMNRKLTDGLENLTLYYKQPYMTDNTLVTTKEELLALLQENREIDRKRLQTTIGPHRDDICFFSGAKDLKKFGSQGQQRTAILSLKLSELEFIKSEVGEYPILLLDDVLSELDEARRSNLIKFIHRRIQTVITTTDITDFQQLGNVQYIACGGEEDGGDRT